MAAAAPADPDARARLLEAALEVFGTCNLEGATTRQLAERAGVNQAAIPYYFGGKEGLYRAAVESIVGHMRERMQPVVAALRGTATTAAGRGGSAALSREQASRLSSS